MYGKNQISYIASSYPKWIEESGAKAIPIPYNLSFEKIKKLMHEVNGILLPGGDISVFWKSSHSRYVQTLKYVFEQFIHMNSIEQIYFPLWGTCQGFEQILQYFSEGKVNVTHVDDLRVNHNIEFQKKIKKSRFRKYLTKDSLKSFSEGKVAFYAHQQAISEKEFSTNEKLNGSLYEIATNVTNDGKKIVSIVEGKT